MSAFKENPKRMCGFSGNAGRGSKQEAMKKLEGTQPSIKS